MRSPRASALPPDKVRVVCRYMGGGFGSKNGPDDYTFIAAELAKRTHRPVKCALTRREENTVAGNRNATIQRLTVGARSDGTLTALGGEFVNAVGWDGWSSGTEGPMQMLYACPNVKTTTYGAKLNLPPMKAFRAPGFVEGTFGLEALLDELASKLDLDPLELRRRNHTEQAPEGNEYSGKNLLECYRRAEPHWERRHEVRARSTATVKRGVGMASQIWYGGGGPPSYAWIRVGSDGRATVVTAMQDIGTGTKTAMAQIAAEELGIPLDHVTVTLGDSDRGPYAAISAGSSTTPSMGPAVRAAAADAREQIEDIAEQRGLKGAPVAEVVDVLEDSQILGKGARGPNPTGMQVLTFGVQVAEVAVDVETGEVWVERIAAVHDVGRVINPLGASSQIEGGIIQGIGHTLSEERLHDPATGRLLTTTLDAYKLPTIADVPEIVSELVDEPDLHLTNLGSKGLGEPPIIPTAAAIANAIRDATGADVRQLPISREEMLRALREAEATGEGEGWSSGGRLASRTSATASSSSRAGPRSSRSSGRALSRDSPWSFAAVVPRGIVRRGSAPARRSRSSSATPRSRKCCARHAGLRRAPSCGTWARSPATCCSRPAAGTGASTGRAACTAETSASPATGSTASTRSSQTTSARPRIPPTSPPRCSRSTRRCGRRRASCRSRSSTASRPTTTAGRRRSSTAR